MSPKSDLQKETYNEFMENLDTYGTKFASSLDNFLSRLLSNTNFQKRFADFDIQKKWIEEGEGGEFNRLLNKYDPGFLEQYKEFLGGICQSETFKNYFLPFERQKKLVKNYISFQED